MFVKLKLVCIFTSLNHNRCITNAFKAHNHEYSKKHIAKISKFFVGILIAKINAKRVPIFTEIHKDS